jgi:hypothetical protein
VEEIKEDGEVKLKESKAQRKIIGSPRTFFENAEGEILGGFKAILPMVGLHILLFL